MANRAKTFTFKSEAKELLDLMIHSLYSNKEIFQQCLIKVKAKKLDVALRCLRAWGFFYNNILRFETSANGIEVLNTTSPTDNPLIPIESP